MFFKLRSTSKSIKELHNQNKKKQKVTKLVIHILYYYTWTLKYLFSGNAFTCSLLRLEKGLANSHIGKHSHFSISYICKSSCDFQKSYCSFDLCDTVVLTTFKVEAMPKYIKKVRHNLMAQYKGIVTY